MGNAAPTLNPRRLAVPCGRAGLAQAQAWELAAHVPRLTEGPLASGMSELRRRDFLLGRLAAARAIAQLGVPSRPVTRRGQAPHFGDDLRGSISHSHGLAVALVVPATEALGVGLDVELGRLSSRAANRILAIDERRWVAQARDIHRASWRATLLFSIKESTFKALSPSFETPPSLGSVVVECTHGTGPVRAHATFSSGGILSSISLDIAWHGSGAAIISVAIFRST